MISDSRPRSTACSSRDASPKAKGVSNASRATTLTSRSIARTARGTSSRRSAWGVTRRKRAVRRPRPAEPRRRRTIASAATCGKAEPSDHRHAEFTDHWIRKRIDERRGRGRLRRRAVPPEFEALPPAERAFYRGRAASLRAHSVPRVAESAVARRRGRSGSRSRSESPSPEAWFFLGKALTARGRHRDAAGLCRGGAKDPEATTPRSPTAKRSWRESAAGGGASVPSDDPRSPESAAPLAELARCRAQQRGVQRRVRPVSRRSRATLNARFTKTPRWCCRRSSVTRMRWPRSERLSASIPRAARPGFLRDRRRARGGARARERRAGG
jgi:hypothetical protein